MSALRVLRKAFWNSASIIMTHDCRDSIGKAWNQCGNLYRNYKVFMANIFLSRKFNEKFNKKIRLQHKYLSLELLKDFHIFSYKSSGRFSYFSVLINDGWFSYFSAPMDEIYVLYRFIVKKPLMRCKGHDASIAWPGKINRISRRYCGVASNRRVKIPPLLFTDTYF